MSGLIGTARWTVSLATGTARHPVEFYDRLRGRRERRGQEAAPQLTPTHKNGLTAAHEILDVATCTDCEATLPDVRAAVAGRLSGTHHHDGGTSMAELLWCLVRHLQPEKVVETGVARGISSAFTLDALSRNGKGRLWSIDLPPVTPGWHDQSGIAVAPDHRGRWTYVRGASRRKLPGLLRSVGEIDLFNHDGLHTRENQLFEYRAAWPYLRVGGILASDDIGKNNAFTTYASEVGRTPTVIREVDKGDAVGLLRR